MSALPPEYARAADLPDRLGDIWRRLDGGLAWHPGADLDQIALDFASCIEDARELLALARASV